jgi:iron complex outermembrane recepter protein
VPASNSRGFEWVNGNAMEKLPMSKSPLSLAVLALLASMGGGYQSKAQAQTQAASASGADAQVITVTAQRRGERILDVPISMSAFTAASIGERGALKLEDLSASVSNVTLYKLPTGQPTWIIRGVGLADFSPNNTPTAAIYQDDVYQSSTIMSQLSMFDLERVEVLKGPQGGLYGRNASGGAVKLITAKPDFGPAGFSGVAGVDQWRRVRLGGAVNAVLAPDTVALRVAFDANTGVGDAGPYKLVNDGSQYGKPKSLAVRATGLAKLGGGSTVTLALEGASDKSETPRSTAIGAYAPPASVGTGVVQARALCAAVQQGRLDDATCLTHTQWNEIALSGSSNQSAARATPGRSSLSDPFGKMDVNSAGGTLTGDFRVAGLRLVSITNARKFDWTRGADIDATRGEYAHTVGTTTIDAWSQEARLQQDEGRFKWTVGASYSVDKLQENRTFFARDNVQQERFYRAFGVANASQLVLTLKYDQKTTSSSVFGSSDWEFAPQWTLGSSIRYTDESKEYRNGGFNAPLGTGAVAAAPAIVNFRLASDYKLQNNWSGGLNLRWQPDRQITGYASLQRGFKVGGIFGGFPTSGTESLVPYKEETNDAFEIGAKWQRADGSMGGNVALFHYQYKDAQSFTNVPNALQPGTTLVRLANVGGARHTGLEIEAFVKPIQQLRLDASLGFVDAKFTDDKTFNTGDIPSRVASFKDQQRPFTSRISGSVRGSYEFALASGTLRTAVEITGKSSAYQDKASPADTAFFDLPGYSLVNGRVTYLAPGGWQAALYVKNAGDKAYRITPLADGFGGRTFVYGEPRTVGVEARFDF